MLIIIEEGSNASTFHASIESPNLDRSSTYQINGQIQLSPLILLPFFFPVVSPSLFPSNFDSSLFVLSIKNLILLSFLSHRSLLFRLEMDEPRTSHRPHPPPVSPNLGGSSESVHIYMETRSHPHSVLEQPDSSILEHKLSSQFRDKTQFQNFFFCNIIISINSMF